MRVLTLSMKELTNKGAYTFLAPTILKSVNTSQKLTIFARIFVDMENDNSILLNTSNPIHIGALQRTFIPIIQNTCNKYRQSIHHMKKDGKNGMH